MKRIKWSVVIIVAVLCLPFLLYGGIVMANDRIADGVEQELRQLELPEGTELVESVSIAGKLAGNGNGMQYYGALLIKSEMSEEELQAYFDSAYEGLTVSKQESDAVFSHRYEQFDGGDDLYTVSAWGSGKSGFLQVLLNFDLRGH